MNESNIYIPIHGPVYLDPEACEIYYEPPENFDDAWLADALEGLAIFAADITRWCEQMEDDTLALRFALDDGYADDRVFDDDALPESAHAGLARFVRDITETSDQWGALWSDAENHLGGAIAARLAERSRQYICQFIHFLESNDLDHEVSQTWHIERVLSAHGWCSETLALWVARLGTCAGQHGHETQWDRAISPSLQHYIKANPEQRILLVQLLGSNMVAQATDYLSKDADRARSDVEDNLKFFWNDLDQQGLAELAPAILKEAKNHAEVLISKYGNGGPAEDHRLPHWLKVLEVSAT